MALAQDRQARAAELYELPTTSFKIRVATLLTSLKKKHPGTGDVSRSQHPTKTEAFQENDRRRRNADQKITIALTKCPDNSK